MINTPKREKSRRRPPRDNSAGDTGGEYWEIGDRKHLTLGNKPILATFSGLLSSVTPGFSRLAC